MRVRTKTESFGVLLTREEFQAMQQYLKELHLSASDYLRQVAVRPVMERTAQAKDGTHDQPTDR